MVCYSSLDPTENSNAIPAAAGDCASTASRQLLLRYMTGSDLPAFSMRPWA